MSVCVFLMINADFLPALARLARAQDRPVPSQGISTTSPLDIE